MQPPRADPANMLTMLPERLGPVRVKAHGLRAAWVRAADEAEGDEADAALDAYIEVWTKVAARAHEEPWVVRDNKCPLGFSWTAVSDPDRAVYVECVRFESANLHAARAARLARAIPAAAGSGPPGRAEQLAAQLSADSTAGAAALEGWHNLPLELSEACAVCHPLFWRALAQAAELAPLTDRAERAASEGRLPSRACLDGARAAPRPVARDPGGGLAGVWDALALRDALADRLKRACLRSAVERLRGDAATLPLAARAAAELDAAARAAAPPPPQGWRALLGRPPEAPEAKTARLQAERLAYLARELRVAWEGPFSWNELLDALPQA